MEAYKGGGFLSPCPPCPLRFLLSSPFLGIEHDHPREQPWPEASVYLPPKVKGPSVDIEENGVTAIMLSTWQTSSVGTWPNSHSRSAPRYLSNFGTKATTDSSFWGIRWLYQFLRVPQTCAVFQKRAGIVACTTDRSSYRGDRRPGTSECETAGLHRNQLTSVRVRGRIPLCAPTTRKGFL